MDVALTETVGLSNEFASKTKIFPKRDARPGFRGCGELFFDFCEAGGSQAVGLRCRQDWSLLTTRSCHATPRTHIL